MFHSRRSLLVLLCTLVTCAGSASLESAVRSHDARKLIQEGRNLILASEAQQAGALFERALKRAKADGDLGAQAMAHDGLGLVAASRGGFQRALVEYRTALKLWPAAGEPAEEALTLCNMSEVLVEVGMTEEALGFYSQALKLLTLEKRRDVLFEAYDGIGLAFHDLKDQERAISFYELALKAAQERAQQSRVHHRIGIIYRDEGDLDRAWEELQRSRSLAHQDGDSRWEAFALADLGHLADLRGNDQQGLNLFDWALRLLGSSKEPLPRASMLFGRAEVLRDLGRLDEALETIQESVKRVEPVRADLVDPGMRVYFFSYRQRYYELLVTLLMDQHRRYPSQGWAARAFEASDRSHSRSLLDDVAGEPTSQGRRLEEIQRKLLDTDTTLLAYSLGDRGSFLWVVNRDGIQVFDLPRREDVEDAAARAWNRLSGAGSGPEADDLARTLLPKEIEPLLRQRILVRPDGALHLIPFPLLHLPDGHRLIERHVVSSLPSASFLVGMRERLASRRPPPKELALLADPVFGPEDNRLARIGKAQLQNREEVGEPTIGGLDRLVFSGEEARRIIRLFPADSSFKATGFDASRKATLNPALALYRIIHITTHFIGGDHPDFSGLMLSRYDEQGMPIEGLVRASEIYGLRLPADLVVLSACGSGLGARIRGEGPMGMTRAFFHAGTKRVVVSLWDVADDTTTELMSRFYRQMLDGHLAPADALRAAQLSMATERNPKLRSPHAWGAFVLQGEPR